MVRGFKFQQSLCAFLADVVCPHKSSAEDKRKSWFHIKYCSKCPYYEQFEREIAEVDDRIMDGIDRLHEIRERFERGEISEEEFQRFYWIIDREIDGEVE